MRLENKKVIVTGAGGGIGRAVSVAFAREGAGQVCADIDRDRLAETVSLVEDLGGTAVPVIGDIARQEHAKALAAAAKSKLGGLTTVVTCHIRDVPYLPVTDLSLEDWQNSLDINLTGVFLLLKHTIPLMIRNGGGSIVLMASTLAITPKPGRSWYASQKGGLRSLVKALAIDHAKDNIRANTVSPGPTADQRFFGQWPSEADAHANANTLLKRLGTPEEMAAGAVFMASDEASFVTGTDLLIDGGYTAV
jgi:NAD(P)-dependent dehydrogenase (short-subunit alcohol dehydrogenase family)